MAKDPQDLNLNKLVSFSNVIVCGYIRGLENKLSLSLSLNIIPVSIIEICLRYFAHISGQIFARISIKSRDKFVYIDTEKKKIIEVKTINKGSTDITKLNSNGAFVNNFNLSSGAIKYFNNQENN